MNRTDIMISTSEQKSMKLVGQAQCIGCKSFPDPLLGLQTRKIKTLINKPFSVGFRVLDLSNQDMYRFHKYYFMKKDPSAMNLLTVPDSFTYWVESADI